MTITELLESIRDYYLTRFKQKIVDYRNNGFEVISENEILDKTRIAITEGFFDTPYRIDLFVMSDNKPVESIRVDTESKLSFLPINLQWTSSLEVTIKPFQWNFLTIEFIDNNMDLDWSHLKNWFNEAFRKKTDKGDFKSAVHYISDPYQEDAKRMVDIDFGSGTIDDFENLLDALDKMNLTKVI
jgi:hypothetical protein